MQFTQVGVRAVVDLVLESGQSDAALDADSLAALDHRAGEGGDLLAPVGRRVRPGEGLERGGRGVADAILKGRRLGARPVAVDRGREDADRVVVGEGEDVYEVARARPRVLPGEEDTLALGDAGDVAG